MILALRCRSCGCPNWHRPLHFTWWGEFACPGCLDMYFDALEPLQTDGPAWKQGWA